MQEDVKQPKETSHHKSTNARQLRVMEITTKEHMEIVFESKGAEGPTSSAQELNAIETYITWENVAYLGLSCMCWAPVSLMLTVYGEACLFPLMLSVSSIFPLMSLYYALLGCNRIEAGDSDVLRVVHTFQEMGVMSFFSAVSTSLWTVTCVGLLTMWPLCVLWEPRSSLLLRRKTHGLWMCGGYGFVVLCIFWNWELTLGAYALCALVFAVGCEHLDRSEVEWLRVLGRVLAHVFVCFFVYACVVASLLICHKRE
jgi:hypothetical protein